MENMINIIRSRRSVRTFEPRPLTEEHLSLLHSYMTRTENPYGLSVEFRLLEGMSCPVVLGSELYMGGKIKNDPHMNEAFGYSFQRLLLGAQTLGIGGVWIGGTMDRAAFESKMELGPGEFMPCVSPLGYPAEKMSAREILMRKGVKADHRLPFEQLFFASSFSSPLSREQAGELCLPLEMVRLGPSAVNRQPWRLLIDGSSVHFYLSRAKGFGGGSLDMQKIDMGIALCHFELAAREMGMEPHFFLEDPKLDSGNMEYIASYHMV